MGNWLCSFGVMVCACAASSDGVSRVVDLVDLTVNQGSAHAHSGAKIDKVSEREGGVDFLRISVTPAPRGWAGLRFTVPVPLGTSALSFTCRATGEKPCDVGLTVTDSAGQNYQFPFSIPNGGKWEDVRVDLSKKPRNSWKDNGGKVDGTIHFPILKVSIDRAGRAVFDLASYQAVTTAGRKVLPDYAISAVPSKKHGLFYPSDEPCYTLSIRRRCEGPTLPTSIQWTLTDFWKGEEIATGVWKIGDKALTFGQDVLKRRFGSFRLSLSAGEGDERVVRDVWFGRMVGPDPEPCDWIGSIGGGQSWDLFRAMGIGRMNASVPWDLCEPKKGEYVFPKWFDNYVTNLLAHGIKLHAMTHRPNRLYENPLDPDAFAKYATAYAKHLNEMGVDNVEIWNEPRGSFMGRYGKENRISKFVEFSRVVRDAIKTELPQMTVSVCAEDMDWDLKPMIAAGIAREGDAISFHPYCHEQPRPERSYFLCDNGKAIKELALAHGGATKFRISEFGWTTYTGKGEYLEIAGHYPRASYAHQAQYLVRNYLIIRQAGVDYACQYRFEDRSRRDYTEDNFGFVFEDFTPKPSFCAVAFMARMIGKAEPVAELSDNLGLYRASLFVRGGRKILACWAVEKDVMWTLPEDFGKVVRSFDMMGNEISPLISKERCLRLTERPFYLVGEKL